jgi:EAL domain-containing protein (putative c-di-GMP-specific phosphodiesterase class I)
MHQASIETDHTAATFGRRKVVPRACVADGKPHIRRFLCEALEDLGFITSECDEADAATRVLQEAQPDLFLLGLSAGGIAGNNTLEALKASGFAGSVLVFGPSNSPMVSAILAIGEEIGLTMLALLPTPFSDNDLRNRVAPLLPDSAPPNPPVDVAEAIHANWLELWYQPKVETRTLTLTGAEALVRMRHPTWGVFPPASFVTSDTDPHFGALSDFVMGQAIKDWFYFVEEYGPVELSINLPLDYFRHPRAVDMLARHMPRHPGFAGLIVEMNGNDLVRDVPLAKQAARALQMHNIGISVDNLGAEWPLLMELSDFPFVEIKVDRSFVSGCGDDRLKQSTCRRILELGDEFGARTVAEGVETRSDFIAARDLGFDLIQGFFFAKPMEAQKFARRVLGKPLTLAN